ncbi:hypothetical protein C8R43DRAFT_964760 [Mycena crocata]|nr:hypothetical protein C8R43DRAFT_964760 [Mycena crocata]
MWLSVYEQYRTKSARKPSGKREDKSGLEAKGGPWRKIDCTMRDKFRISSGASVRRRQSRQTRPVYMIQGLSGAYLPPLAVIWGRPVKNRANCGKKYYRRYQRAVSEARGISKTDKHLLKNTGIIVNFWGISQGCSGLVEPDPREKLGTVNMAVYMCGSCESWQMPTQGGPEAAQLAWFIDVFGDILCAWLMDVFGKIGYAQTNLFTKDRIVEQSLLAIFIKLGAKLCRKRWKSDERLLKACLKEPRGRKGAVPGGGASPFAPDFDGVPTRRIGLMDDRTRLKSVVGLAASASTAQRAPAASVEAPRQQSGSGVENPSHLIQKGRDQAEEIQERKEGPARAEKGLAPAKEASASENGGVWGSLPPVNAD